VVDAAEEGDDDEEEEDAWSSLFPLFCLSNSCRRSSSL
jgi:hypothetical protein